MRIVCGICEDTVDNHESLGVSLARADAHDGGNLLNFARLSRRDVHASVLDRWYMCSKRVTSPSPKCMCGLGVR